MCGSKITDHCDEVDDGGEGSSTSIGVAMNSQDVKRDDLSTDETFHSEIIDTNSVLLEWKLDREMTDELPKGYRMVKRGGMYKVIDDEGLVIAGPSDDPVGLINDAWTHYKSENGY